MAFKKIACTFLALFMAALVAAMSGCEDLGAYENTEQYYEAFGDIVLVSAASGEDEAYSVEEYFYNEASRENFLKGEDGAYQGVAHSDYVYMAIPFESGIDMDTLALYLQAHQDIAVYINVFVIDKDEWEAIAAYAKAPEKPGVYERPAPEARVGEVAVHLENGKWSSFALDTFLVNGTTQKSIKIEEGQYVLLHVRNNSGVRVLDEEKELFVDPQTGLALQKAEITVTNLLIRALEIEDTNEVQGGE